MGIMKKEYNIKKTNFKKLLVYLKKIKNLKTKKLKKTGLSGTFAASLELVREGKLSIKQDKIFENIFIKTRN